MTAPSQLPPTNYPPGPDSCGHWLEGERLYAASDRVAWKDFVASSTRRAFVAGYLTAANDPAVKLHVLRQLAEFTDEPVDLLASPVFRAADGAGMFAAVSAFCEEHPAANLRGAAQALLVDLKAY